MKTKELIKILQDIENTYPDSSVYVHHMGHRIRIIEKDGLGKQDGDIRDILLGQISSRNEEVV